MPSFRIRRDDDFAPGSYELFRYRLFATPISGMDELEVEQGLFLAQRAVPQAKFEVAGSLILIVSGRTAAGSRGSAGPLARRSV
jgi:hypothetical protein